MTPSLGDSRDPGQAVLDVQDLRIRFATEGSSPLRIVDGVTFALGESETLGLVGESGAGKSLTALSIMRLLDPIGGIVDGSVKLDGHNLLELPSRAMEDVRGDQISMIFQDPRQSFHPAFTIGEQIAEAYRRHRDVPRKKAFGTAVDMLGRLGIANPQHRAQQYPNTFSGGMLQRAMLAMAVVCSPRVLIADEPTTALDVTVQAQILELIQELQGAFDMSVLFVTHDMGVVADVCDSIAVMYAGQLVEYGPTDEVFRNPRHPYTEGLLTSVPDIDRPTERLQGIPGSVPKPGAYPGGCRFHPRCSYCVEGLCTEGVIEFEDVGTSRRSRCVRTHEIELSGMDL